MHKLPQNFITTLRKNTEDIQEQHKPYNMLLATIIKNCQQSSLQGKYECVVCSDHICDERIAKQISNELISNGFKVEILGPYENYLKVSWK